jgi:hypothetical protein
MNIVDRLKRNETDYFGDSPMKSSAFVMVILLFAVTSVRVVWNVVALWGQMDIHVRLLALLLTAGLHFPLGIVAFGHKRLRDRLHGVDETLRRELARIHLYTPAAAYFLLFLASEVTYQLCARR